MIKRPPATAISKASEDLPFEESSNGQEQSQVKGSKEVPLDSKNKGDETVNVDFVDDAYSNNMASKQTKTADDLPKIDPSTPADKVRAQTQQYEQEKSKTLTFKHYQEIAEFLIHIMDVGMSNALNFIAKDTARSAYTLPAADKKSLSDQLALILCKYQSKFSIEFTFLLAVIVIYSGPVMAAFRKKKENASQPKSEAKKEHPDKAYKRHVPMSEPVPEKKEPVPEPVKKTVEMPPVIEEGSTVKITTPVTRPPVRRRRRRGGQPKA